VNRLLHEMSCFVTFIMDAYLSHGVSQVFGRPRAPSRPSGIGGVKGHNKKGEFISGKPRPMSGELHNTWQLEAKGVRSSGRNQRGYRWLGGRHACMHLGGVDFLEECGFLSHFKINDFGLILSTLLGIVEPKKNLLRNSSEAPRPQGGASG